MSTSLHLVKSGHEINDAQVEKRSIPRFPFSQMVVKSLHSAMVYEVVDISYQGMKINCTQIEEEKSFEGTINWKGKTINIAAEIKWIDKNQAGLEFDSETKLKMRDFLSLENIVSTLRPFHKLEDCPRNLKYWLYTEGPFQILVWLGMSPGILFEKFQIISLDKIVEWEEGEGVLTGKILSRKQIESPLSLEDEFTFYKDLDKDTEAIAFAVRLIDLVNEEFIDSETKDFMQMKLRV